MTQPILAVASPLLPPGSGVEAFGVSLSCAMTEAVWENFSMAERVAGCTSVQIDLRDETEALEAGNAAILAGNLVGVVRTFFTKNPHSPLKAVTITARSELMNRMIAQALILH